MYSLLKIIKNRYVSIILILTLWFIFSRTVFVFLSGINFSVILYVLISSKIDEKTYIPYSIIFGLYSDYIISSYIGLSVLFFLLLSIIKMFSEYKFDSKSVLSIIKMFSEYKFDSKSVLTILLYSIFSIILYNLFLAVVLGYNIGLSILYILKLCLADFVVFIVSYSIMEFNRAFRSVKR